MSQIRTLQPTEVVEEALRYSERLVDDLRILLVYNKIVTGEGLEFERLREYSPGDEARRIDWNALARSNDLYTQIYKEERMLDVVFVFDTSVTMTLGTTELSKNEYASILATTLCRTALDAGDEAGLIAFNEEVREALEPSLSDEMPYQFAEKLSNPELYGGEPNWEELSRTVLRSFNPNTFIFIVSDFINDSDPMYNFILEAAERFKGVFCVMVRDPLDSHLPEGVGKVYLSDPVTGEIGLVDVDEVRDEYNEKAVRQEEKVERRVEAAGGYFFKIHTDQNFIDEFARYLDERAELWK